jgi:hypothetical protein
MTRILEFVIAVVITALLFVLIGLFLPSHGHVEREVELSNPVSQVYDTLNHFKRYNSWQPWYALDPRAQYTIEGPQQGVPEYGVGARIRWNSVLNKQVGEGSTEIIESEPESIIRMALDNPWRGTNKTSTFVLEQSTQTNAVIVKWSIDVDYGWDLMGRYAGLYLNGRVGELMNEGLGRLASIMATVPNVDYSQVEVQVAEVPEVDLLFIGDGVPAAPRQWDTAMEKTEKAFAEIEAFIKRNNLQAVGPRRRIINVLGEENNDFNFAIPVAPHAATPVGRVQVGKGYGGRVVMTQYRGHRVGLNKPRDMLKAYALTHGFEFDRDMTGSWEEWLPETAEDEGAETLTNLHLPFR